MKSPLLFVLVYALSSCHSGTRNPTLSIKEDTIALSKVLIKQKNDWNQGNIDAYMQGYYHSDSIQFITRRGIRYGYDSICARYKRSYNSKEKMGQLTFDHLRYLLLSDHPGLYQVSGNWSIMGQDSAKGNFSLIFKKFDQEWKIIIDHTW